MAQHKSAKKRMRRNARRAVVNHARVNRVRTSVKGVETAIASGDAAQATAALKSAMPEIMRGAGKGVVPKRTAARRVARLAQRVRKMSAAKPSA